MKLTILTVATVRALEAYEAGDLRGALASLEGIEAAPLPDRPEWIAHELEQRADRRDTPCPQAAAEWIEHARARIRRELGEDVIGAVVPVRLALQSALTCLQV
jgi:F420-0:gamma-glutamyl ligase-like protein